MITLYESDIDDLMRYFREHQEPVEVRLDHVGAGMSGRSCLGFVTDNPYRVMLKLGRLLGSDLVDPGIVDALQDFDVRVDHLPHPEERVVLYFPTVVVLRG